MYWWQQIAPKELMNNRVCFVLTSFLNLSVWRDFWIAPDDFLKLFLKTRATYLNFTFHTNDKRQKPDAFSIWCSVTPHGHKITIVACVLYTFLNCPLSCAITLLNILADFKKIHDQMESKRSPNLCLFWFSYSTPLNKSML